MREFETISNTYQNPSGSKPWAIAQAFWSKSVDFGPLGISRNLFQQAPKQLEFHFKAYRRLLREFETISNTYQNPSCSKPWAIAQAFWSKSVDFEPLGISRNLFQQAPKQLEFHFKAYRRLLREFETISNTYQNPSCSKPWAIAQAFWSKSVDFGPLGIYPKSVPTSSKTVRIPF